MANFERKSGAAVALILAIATPLPFLSLLVNSRAEATPSITIAQAQTNFSIPDSLPKGSQLTISGDGSTQGISKKLKAGFESKFSNSKVTLKQASSQQSLKELEAGQVDLAVIGRPLSSAEQSQGLTSVPISRQKIAIFTSAQSPISGSLTNTQFAQIFSGEITNWSQVGGPDKPIRLLHPKSNDDLTASLAHYPVFTVKDPVGEGVDTEIDQLIQQLGDDGITYAPADQVIHRQDVSILPLHHVYPDDARYSFSQPYSYIYQGSAPNPAVQAFLGFSQDPAQVASIEAGRLEPLGVAGSQVPTSSQANPSNRTDNTTSSPSSSTDGGNAKSNTNDQPIAATQLPNSAQLDGNAALKQDSPTLSDQATSSSPKRRGGNWWWLLLPLLGLPLLGALFLKHRKDAGGILPSGAMPGAFNFGDSSRLVMVARDCHHAYAFWELNDADRQVLADHPSHALQLRVWDVTPDGKPSTLLQTIHCDRHEPDCQVPIEMDNRDYIAQLGYLDDQGHWQKFATSEPVLVPTCDRSTQGTTQQISESYQPNLATSAKEGLGNLGKAGIGVAVGGLGLAGSGLHQAKNTLEQAKDKMGQSAQDVTDQAQSSLESLTEASVDATKNGVSHAKDQGGNLGSKAAGMIGTGLGLGAAGLGKLKDQAHHIKDEASEVVSESKEKLMDQSTEMRETLRAKVSHSHANLAPESLMNSSSLPIPFTRGVTSANSSWINLIPHNSHQGEVTWHLSTTHLKQLDGEGEGRVILRVHDAHHLQLQRGQTEQTLEFSPHPQDRAMIVDLPAGDRDYVAELGYYTDDQRWVSLIRSIHSHLPNANQDGTRVMIMPCDPYHLSLSDEQANTDPKAYLYWDIAPERKAQMRAQGGNILVVRVYGYIDGDRSNLSNYRQVSENIIHEDERDRVVALPEGDRDYRAEVGYLTIQGDFLCLGQSEPILIPKPSIQNA